MNADMLNGIQADVLAEIERKGVKLAAARAVIPGAWSCARRSESFGAFAYPETDTWRADGTCSYCGSLSPAALFAAIEPPHVILGGVEGYSLISVRHALRELVRQGRVTFAGADCERLYWRTRPAEAGSVARAA